MVPFPALLPSSALLSVFCIVSVAFFRYTSQQSLIGVAMRTRLLPLFLLLSSACLPFSSQKSPAEAEIDRSLVIETPDPVEAEDRMDAAALRATDEDPRTRGRRGRRSTATVTVPAPSKTTTATAAPAKPASKTPAKGKEPVAPPQQPSPTPDESNIPALVLSPEMKNQAIGDVSLQILFLDVKQADAILIVGPKGTLLVDAGEVTLKQKKSDNYRKIVKKLNELTGKSHIDYFVPSHYHADHIGTAGWSNGLWGLIDSGVTIDTIVDRGDYFIGQERPGGWKQYPESVQGWIESGIVKRRLLAELGKKQIDLGEGVEVEIVAVNSNGILELKDKQNPGYFDKCPPSENDYSVALIIRVGNFEFFTGGDMSGEDVDRSFGKECQSYNDVETTLAPSVGNIEVFKVTHHGSGHSNNKLFLQTLDPEFSVVPSGGGYSHPEQDVAKRLTETGVTVDTGGFSPKEWPSGPPDNLPVVGDVLVQVARGGGKYLVKYGTTSKLFKSFSDTEESQKLDQKHTPEVLTK